MTFGQAGFKAGVGSKAIDVGLVSSHEVITSNANLGGLTLSGWANGARQSQSGLSLLLDSSFIRSLEKPQLSFVTSCTFRLENDRFQRWSRFSHFLFAGAARGHLAELEGSHLRVDGPQSKSCASSRKCVHLHFRLEVFHFAHFKQPGRRSTAQKARQAA